MVCSYEQCSKSVLSLLFIVCCVQSALCGLLAKLIWAFFPSTLASKNSVARERPGCPGRTAQTRHLVDGGALKCPFHPIVHSSFCGARELHECTHCPATEKIVGGPVVLCFVIRKNQANELDQETGKGSACLLWVVLGHLIMQLPGIVSRGTLNSPFTCVNLEAEQHFKPTNPAWRAVLFMDPLAPLVDLVHANKSEPVRQLVRCNACNILP